MSPDFRAAGFRPARPLAPAVATVLLTIAAASTVQAQDGERPWSFENEVGASVFFGATSQSAVLFRSEYAYEGERLVTTLNAGFDYAESENGEGESFVSNRSWTSGVEVDYDFERWSPFVFGTADGSLARSIDLRLTSGIGAKYRFVDTESTRLDASLAALIERTDPRTPEGVSEEIETLGRWSARVRASRSFAADRVEFDFTGFYKPAFDAFSDDYVVDVKTGLAFVLTDAVALKVSLVDVYDSLAEARGSRSNNDGRLFFSVITTLD